LLQKIYGEASLGEFDRVLAQLFEGLKVTHGDLEIGENNWVKVKVSGADAKVVIRLLDREIGLAPVDMEKINRFSVLNGRVAFSEKGSTFVDIGIIAPEIIYGMIGVKDLRRQLANGGRLTHENLVRLYPLVDNFPVEIRVISIGESNVVVEFTERQMDLFSSWLSYMVDRLIILGAINRKVREIVRRANLKRDIIGFESLGTFEQILICKMGTDAAGLIPKIGRRIPKASFSVFSPREVLRAVSLSGV
jgi:hypothetical protein